MLIGQIEYELLEANLWYFGQMRYSDLEAAPEERVDWRSELGQQAASWDEDDSTNAENGFWNVPVPDVR